MILVCTYCTTPFEHFAGQGRPPSFCGGDCRDHAKRDPMRICRGCGKRVHKTNMEYPAYCNFACKESERDKCMNCGGPTPQSGRFCSGDCLVAHQGETAKSCDRCGGTIPTPTSPPFNRMPRFCSELCRTSVAVEHGHMQPKAQAEGLFLRQVLDYMPQPLWRLPHKSEFVPFMVPPSLVPNLDDYLCTAKVLNSISFWNHVLPILSKIEPSWVLVSYVGRMNLGGSGPTAILPLYECLPWVESSALVGIDIDNVIAMWRIAAKNKRHSEREIERRKEKLREWIIEYESGSWANNAARRPFFTATEVGSSPFVQNIRKWQAMHSEVPLSMVYLPEHVTWLNGRTVAKALTDLENIRTKQRSWQVAKYKDDPPMPPDRTLDAIERIMDAERRRLSR